MADYSKYPHVVQCEGFRQVRITVEQWNHAEGVCPANVYFPHEAECGANPWREVFNVLWDRHPMTKVERYEVELLNGRTAGFVEPSFPLYVHETFADKFGVVL